MINNRQFLTKEATLEDIQNINNIPQLQEHITTVKNKCNLCFLNDVDFPICHVVKCMNFERLDNKRVYFTEKE